jgi:predicted anti-sigma-YlaC factor YlaD
MNCTETRPLLPALLYGDLTASLAVQVEAHRATCPACAAEFEALRQVRGALDAVPAASATVDLAQLYRDAAQRHQRSLRRLRRVCVAVVACAAAVVLIVGLSRLEVRFEGHQVVVRWGAPPLPESPPAPVPAPVAVVPSQRIAEIEDRINLLGELVQALSADADRRSVGRDDEIVTLRREIRDLQEQLTQLRLATDRDVAALYAAQFVSGKKGETP